MTISLLARVNLAANPLMPPTEQIMKESLSLNRESMLAAHQLPDSSPQPCSRRQPYETGNRTTRRLPAVRVRAFSLVEIVLAIGVIAFAFVTMVGMLPVGLNTFRQTVDTTIGSQIMQRIVDEAQQTDYSTLTLPANQAVTRYFDAQGNEVPDIDASLYTVRITVTSPTALPNTSTPDSTNLATVTVMLASNAGHNVSPFGVKYIPCVVNSVLIAKNA